ncbi:MAG: fibronectin type III domain-containing protein, partial [Myxococcota bacterium]
SDPQEPGIQLIVTADANAPDDTEITLSFNENPVISKVKNKKVSFTVTLTEGQSNTLQLTANESVCNLSSSSKKISVSVEDKAAPNLNCALLQGPPFNANTSEASIKPDNDIDAQTPGVQNGIRCTSNAEEGQPVEFTFNGAAQTKNLSAGTGSQTVEFSGLTFKEGINTLELKVTRQNNKTKEVKYTVIVDTTAPQSIVDLKAAIEDHRSASAKLTWTAPNDNGQNPSGIARYEIRWKEGTQPITASEWPKLSNIRQVNKANQPNAQESFILDNLRIGKNYVIAIRSVDRGDNFSEISNSANITFDFKQAGVLSSGPDSGLFGRSSGVIGDVDKDGLLDFAISEKTDTSQGKTSTGAI